MIASRVWASVSGPIRLTPSPSGPRCRRASTIRCPASGEVEPAGSRIAPMPHMRADCHSRVWSGASRRRSMAAFRKPTEEASVYRLMGRAHAAMVALCRERGQGTVEYVALILLVALVMAGMVAAMKGFKTDEGQELGDVILGKIKEAVRKVQF